MKILSTFVIIKSHFLINYSLSPSKKRKRRGEDEREGGPVVGGEKKDGGKKGVNFNKTLISFQNVSSFSFLYLLIF